MAYNIVLQVHEVIAKIVEGKTKKEKVELLKQYESWPLKDVLRCIYDDTIQFLLPGGKPPYTPNLAQSAPSSITRRHKDFKYFVKGGPGVNIQGFKREKMFIDLLESVHPDEALLLIDMMNKKAITGLTKATVKEAYPNLIRA